MSNHSTGIFLRPAAIRRIVIGLILVSVVLPVLVAAEEGLNTLQNAIDKAQPGARLVLDAGVYRGSVSIDKPLILEGGEGSIIDGNGSGRVITVNAANVEIRGLTIRNSGDSLATEDSGIFVTEAAENALIELNHLEGNLIGVYLKGPVNARVRKNTIYGSRNRHMNERGNGVHIWNSPGAIVEDNRLRYGRDGIFVTSSRNNIFRNNHFQDMRFAIHYMYTNHSEVSGNVSIGNHSAFALMYSDNLQVFGNSTDAARDRGLFLNFVNYSSFRENTVLGSTEKCVFIYNANFNTFDGNHFEACDIGIHFTAGSEKNVISGNSFIDNRTQVKYVGTRYIEWSANGQGNFWSDNLAYDMNNDGIADRPYHPNDMVDQIIWRHPLAKLLLNSPATQLLRWAQSEFPSLYPGGVTDSAPLMDSPTMTLSQYEK
ncbi:MAG: nitrous oxide reductase family maturation protein NosD [Gammaproteobacteria bacterium]|nr:nitrous oxide reductase family maturation protein NosD [Gammaproteobacteria bacterium]